MSKVRIRLGNNLDSDFFKIINFKIFTKIMPAQREGSANFKNLTDPPFFFTLLADSIR